MSGNWRREVANLGVLNLQSEHSGGWYNDYPIYISLCRKPKILEQQYLR